MVTVSIFSNQLLGKWLIKNAFDVYKFSYIRDDKNF